jgi:aryl-alcohol dehydrogenase-like predicted oxidoreductase
VGILARLPLSSGMLAGKMTRTAQFAPDDHRLGNRQGEWFDRGETFSGVDFETGLEAVEALRPLVPPGVSMAQFAMRWILEFDAYLRHPRRQAPDTGGRKYRCRRPAAAQPGDDAGGAAIYESIQPLVHHYW